MKKQQHTPGPWETDCKDHDAPYQNITVNSGCRKICTLWIDDAPVHDYNAEQEANARLIAAAPELLETLKTLVTEIILSDVDMEYIDSHFMPHIEKARAAIAKATGGQS